MGQQRTGCPLLEGSQSIFLICISYTQALLVVTEMSDGRRMMDSEVMARGDVRQFLKSLTGKTEDN
jgi:hypothetical protein